ncbi:MAG TPA: hypothetical protein VGO43_11885 [Pyrinomonadaceae bacterium]|jgi:hypothetical protein|nr:hypothetical protein [Pyrinomonadaceae bacterium]
MDITAEIRAKLGDDWLPSIYEHKIRPLRTRSLSIDVPAKENAATINYTLLGIELQIGRRRFACPDLATARYMRIFARVGCSAFAAPYDITQISALADDLETSWQRMLLLIAASTGGKPTRSVSQTRSRIIRAIRDEIERTGAGEVMPAFDRETRQRK